jgi:hypothetical protein
MVAVKEQTKVMTGTVVKIDVDDAGAIRVTTGNMTQIDIDDDDEDEDEDEYTPDEDDILWDDDDEPVPCSFPVYQPKEIEYHGKKYTFKEPLDCKVLRGTGITSYCIEYDPFGIWGTGETWEQAVDFFNFQFASKYDWLNEFTEERVGQVYRDVLKLMNSMVINVEEWSQGKMRQQGLSYEKGLRLYREVMITYTSPTWSMVNP